MNYRNFGTTDLKVSEIGFGAWAIGGPASVGDVEIGWGDSNDKDSTQAIHTALDFGINFFDTADFYGLGHSEKLLGQTLQGNTEVLIATKVGQKKMPNDTIQVDYGYDYIKSACEKSLKRLKRDQIDFYQLHTAKVKDLENGESVQVMNDLQKEGKIRYWGVSVNTFYPEPESDFMLSNDLGHGVQLVLNVINQKAIPLLHRFAESGYGIIARMPLQFGLLAKKFSTKTKFSKNDHRFFRLTPEIISRSNASLAPLWEMGDKYDTSPVGICLSFILSYPEISTVIPGIRTSSQVESNVSNLIQMEQSDRALLEKLYHSELIELLGLMKAAG